MFKWYGYPPFYLCVREFGLFDEVVFSNSFKAIFIGVQYAIKNDFFNYVRKCHETFVLFVSMLFRSLKNVLSVFSVSDSYRFAADLAVCSKSFHTS